MDVENRNHMENDVQTICTEVTKETGETLPTYHRESESLVVTNQVPSLRKPTTLEVDSANLHALLSTLITCTFPLTKLLNMKLELWVGVASYLTKQGVWSENIHLKEVLHDSGVRISIATKSIWEKWGKVAVQSTHMNLQLATGSLENPIGVLENVTTVKSCGIEYLHTFAIVDFESRAN